MSGDLSLWSPYRGRLLDGDGALSPYVGTSAAREHLPRGWSVSSFPWFRAYAVNILPALGGPILRPSEPPTWKPLKRNRSTPEPPASSGGSS